MTILDQIEKLTDKLWGKFPSSVGAYDRMRNREINRLYYQRSKTIDCKICGMSKMCPWGYRSHIKSKTHKMNEEKHSKK